MAQLSAILFGANLRQFTRFLHKKQNGVRLPSWFISIASTMTDKMTVCFLRPAGLKPHFTQNGDSKGQFFEKTKWRPQNVYQNERRILVIL